MRTGPLLFVILPFGVLRGAEGFLFPKSRASSRTGKRNDWNPGKNSLDSTKDGDEVDLSALASMVPSNWPLRILVMMVGFVMIMTNLMASDTGTEEALTAAQFGVTSSIFFPTAG